MLDGKERQYRLPELYGENVGRLGLRKTHEATAFVRLFARKVSDIQVKVNDKRKAELERITQAAANLKTLRNLFDEYAQNCQQKDGGKELQQSFKRDVFPIIDDYQLGKIHPEHIEKILRGAVKRGSHCSAVTLFADINQLFCRTGRKQA